MGEREARGPTGLPVVGRSLDYVGSSEPKLIPMVTLHPEPPVEFDVRAR